MDKLNLPFEQLPNAVTMLTKEVSDLKQLIIAKQEATPNPEKSDKLLTIDEVAKLLHLAKPTIYSKVSRNELPFMKRGKRLYFSRTEIMDFIKAGRRKTTAEIEQEAETYLSNNKKGLNSGK